MHAVDLAIHGLGVNLVAGHVGDVVLAIGVQLVADQVAPVVMIVNGLKDAAAGKAAGNHKAEKSRHCSSPIASWGTNSTKDLLQ